MDSAILITGASGYIGQRLVRYYLEKGVSVIGLGRYVQSTFDNRNFFKLKCDITENSDIERVIEKLSDKKIGTLFHLAAELHSPEKFKLFKCNTDGTSKVLNLSVDLNIEKLIFASTTMAMGPVRKKEIPADENKPCRPVSDYGKSKLKAEQILLKQNYIPVTILRFGYVYGPNYASILEPLFSPTEKKGYDFLYHYQPYKHEGNKQSLQFICIDDVIRALVCAAEKPEVTGIFNIVDHEYMKKEQIVDMIHDAKEKNLKRIALKYKVLFFFKKLLGILRSPYDFKRIHWVYSNKKALEQLNFEPEIILRDRLNTLIDPVS